MLLEEIHMRFIQLMKLGKGLYTYMLIAIVLLVFSRVTYSMIPLFTQYVFKTLLEQPGISDPNLIFNDVNLPSVLTRYFALSESVMEEIIKVAVILMVLQIVRFFFRYIELYIRGFVQNQMGQNLRVKMYRHIQGLPYTFHNNSDSGDLIQRSTSDIETSVRFVSGTFMEFIFLFSTLIFGAYQIYAINALMVFILLGIMPFVAISSIWYFKKNDKMYQEVEEAESNMMTVIQENLSSARIVRAFGNEAYEIKKMREKNDTHREKRLKTGKIVSRYWGIMDFIAIIQYVFVSVLGIFFLERNVLDPAQITAVLGLVGMLIWPIRGLGHMINDYAKALASSKRIFEILHKPLEFETDGKLKPEIKGSITFDHVSFKFDDTESHVLKDISFDIKAGETVAFIGRTGSGKSTIMNLLMRMYDYDKGEIRIDGVVLKDIDKKHMRSHLGVVLQEPFLFSKTVFENITIANRKATKERVFYAAQTASLERDIKTFKKGYETIVGEKGTTLSGGQKQRVAIARILVSEKPILIFDDALSAVDSQTDLLIREALKNQTNKQTTLIITHRMATAREASKIIVLDKGLIEAIGTHDELILKPGLYQDLWNIQGRLEKEFLDALESEV
jgi:ATP-binding cassette, subfamily B, bacterial